MRALTVVPGAVAVAERPDPEPGVGEVVVSVHSCGICGSDVHGVESGRAAPGSVLGHEFAGTIAEIGPGAGDWSTGQAVAVNPLGSCGACDACRRGLPFLCPRPNIGLTAPGGFAELVAVPGAQLHALPDGLEVELGAHVEPLAVALRAVELAGWSPGDDALVFGVGSIGLSVILALRASGPGRIVAFGRSPGRRAAAARVGADLVLDARETSVAEHVAATGGRVSAVFECSGAPEAVAACTPALAPGGTIVEVGLPRAPAPVDLAVFVGQNLHLVGSCAFDVGHYRAALALIASGAVDVEPLVSERVTLDDAPEAFRRLAAPRDLVGVLVQPWR